MSLRPSPTESLAYLAAGIGLPKLSIQIPTVSLTESVSGGGVVTIPWLAEYMVGVYQYGLSVGAVIAAVMMVWGGFKWMYGDAKGGKDKITNAAIGLVILFGAYIILNVVNPELTTLKGLQIEVVKRDPLDALMSDTAGFKNGSAEAVEGNEGGAANAVGESQTPPPATNTTEFSIADVDLTGASTGPERLFRFCTKKADMASASGYEGKVGALVRAVLGFKKVCIDEKRCAYYRGGYTYLPSGTVQGSQVDLPFAISATRKNFKLEPNWPSGCQEEYDNQLAGKLWYSVMMTKSTASEHPRFLPKGACYVPVAKQYQDNYSAAYKNSGTFGGDCGTTLVQIYACAGAKVITPSPWGGSGASTSAAAYTSGTRYGKGNKGDDVVVFAARNEEDFLKQAEAHGGLKFGDIVNMGSANYQHNIMYTGGRSDVPFTILEMGGPGIDGKVGVMVDVGFPSKAKVGGMGVSKTQTVIDYIRKFQGKSKKSLYPVMVWRPYGN